MAVFYSKVKFLINNKKAASFEETAFTINLHKNPVHYPQTTSYQLDQLLL
jgi:hypothetical protein